MNTEIFFKCAFAGLLILFQALRLYYGHQATKSEIIVKSSHLKQDKLGVFFAILLPIATVALLYLFQTPWISSATIALPVSLRFFGVLLLCLSLGLYWWILASLGKQWSLYLVIKEDHQLIDFGPYRWVRHPMYTVFFLMAMAFFLISANALVGASWLGLCGLILTRIAHEESLLIHQFGAQYQQYQQTTGRFLPRLWVSRLQS